MRKLAFLSALTVAVAAPRAAHACNDCGGVCDIIFTPVALALGGAVVGGYAYGTGYYAMHDLDGDPHSISYYGSELMLHGSLGTVFTKAAIDAAHSGDNGTMIGAGAFAALHMTLAVHGADGMWAHRDEIGSPSATLMRWGLGSAYGINALYWASTWPDAHGRGYGLAEVAINAPIAAGLGVLAHERFASEHAGPGLLYGGMAALSTVYVVKGLSTIASPHHTDKLDLLGTDIAPTMVSDGRELAPGLGAARTF
jgi:hypothetical protein